jgi:formylglycine-generating enzyme required for sulfatase activity
MGMNYRGKAELFVIVVFVLLLTACGRSGSPPIVVSVLILPTLMATASGGVGNDPLAGEMVLVQGGMFTMGCTAEQGNDCWSDESPTHQVTLSSFSIGKYEVTQWQWKAVMGANNNPSNFVGDNLPVERVSYDEVQEFIRKLNAATGMNYRLPTEAEWQYAARGGNQSRGYKYSGSNAVGDVAWYWDNSGIRTHPVGIKNANELGIYDMSGNVMEWLNDWYGDYSSDPQTNPQGPSSGSLRVFRGGGWRDGARGARVSARSDRDSGYRSRVLGFRLARRSE